MQSVLGRLGAVIVAVATWALFSGSAWGNTYTNVNPPPAPELSHLEILESIYGGGWSANGLDFSNNDGVTAKRVWDTDGQDELIHVLLGDETHIDQVWTDGTVTVTAEVKYAEFAQSFGWNGGGLGTNYVELLTEDDIGGPPEVIDITGEFLWGLQPTEGHPEWGHNYLWWSKQSLNDDGPWGLGNDHMVTYFVEGLADVDETVWLLFWEDYPCGGDEDFNDFVIEVRAIPEPSTALLLAGGLLALGLSRRRRS